MKVITMLARGVARLLTTIAKTLGGMGGAKTFDHDEATKIYNRREDYRP